MKHIQILLCCLAGMTAVATNAAKPNILFVMSDDHTSQAVGVYGGRLAKLNPTPTIDSLAREGIVMENAFCTNAICSPSRACIMTGQYSAVNGVTDLNGGLKPENQYLAIEMKQAGYDTAVIGKWHLKERPEAFDYFKVLPGQGNYMNPTFVEKGATNIVESKKGTLKGVVKMKGHSSDCIADSALNWLENIRDPEKPFFLKFHFKAPHDMFQPAPRYNDYLKDVEIPYPDSLFDNENNGSIATRGFNDELLHKIGTSVGRRHSRNYVIKRWVPNADSLSDLEAKKQAYQGYMKDYLRCVKGVDDNLKRVIDYLKEKGLYDNTVIIYTGDQGFYLGEHDYIDKRWGYEEGIRMPFIVRYPKTIEAGTRSDAIVENVDYAPTMLGFAGVETPAYMQGQSFQSTLETGVESADSKQAAYYHYWMHMKHHSNPGHIGIRTKRYKLLFFYGAPQNSVTAQTPPAWELYDLSRDPKEMNNVYDNPEYAAVIEQLKDQLKAMRAKNGEDDPKFPCNQVIEDYWDYDDDDRARAVAISNRLAGSSKKKGRKEETN